MIELIVAKDEAVKPSIEPNEIKVVNEQYDIWIYDSANLPELSIEQYSYLSIPKCLGLSSEIALEESGIITLQNYPTLSLKGQGVLVAVIDTGINYKDEIFFDKFGKSKVFSMWNQITDEIYSNEELTNRIPENNDENGHGTFLASLICGQEDKINEFIGAAPEAELLVVKLKPAYKELREFYFVPEDAIAFAESDVMLGIVWADEIATRLNKPLVICLGIGGNNGSHSGDLPLAEYLDFVGRKSKRAVVIAAGNQANAAKHYKGVTTNALEPEKVEINITENMKGLYFEIWGKAPEIFALSVQSPSGEVIPKSIPIAGVSGNYKFLFENTSMSIDYRVAGKSNRNQLIFVRLVNPVRGIWTVRIYPKNNIRGEFHIWLPMQSLLESDANFLMSNPENTITMPADARVPMTAGGYDVVDNAVYLDSGRGFDINDIVKPDLIAPAVNISGRGLLDNYINFTGTSAAAAIVAGGCAQVLEYNVVRGNETNVNSVDIKNFFIRGAIRNSNEIYPSKQKGYGIFNIYNAFLNVL